MIKIFEKEIRHTIILILLLTVALPIILFEYRGYIGPKVSEILISYDYEVTYADDDLKLIRNAIILIGLVVTAIIVAFYSLSSPRL